MERCAVLSLGLASPLMLPEPPPPRHPPYPAAPAGEAASLIDRPAERSLSQEVKFYGQVRFYRFSST